MGSLRTQFTKGLSNQYSERESSLLWRRALECVCAVEHSRTFFIDENDLTDAQKESMLKISKRLSDGEPLEYIIGYAEFCSMKFRVNRHVLIPRMETQEMVQSIKEKFSDKEHLRVLDIGTGSGCIGVTLGKMLPSSHITALDISRDALDVARENALLHGVDNINFIEADFLNEAEAASGLYDIIVSNPPYVRPSETPTMPVRVLDFEPHTALFVEESDPLVFYRHIARFALENLKASGTLFVEINQWLGAETEKLFTAYGFDAKIVKDLFLEDRFVTAIRR